MAGYTILKRELKGGKKKYRCLVRKFKGRKVIYSKCKTFDKSSLAKSWGLNQIAAFEKESIRSSKNNTLTIRGMIYNYIHHDHIKLGRTKLYVLKLLMDCDIAKIKVREFKPHHLVKHCSDRIESGAGKSTVNHDVSYLRSVFRIANTLWGIDVSDNLFAKTLPTLHHLNLIGESNRRTRRPTSEEIDELIDGLKEREKLPTSLIPYVDILNFSILSCMRIGEVCSIKWGDLDREHKSVIVRDRKDPRKKTGNHMIVPLLGGAYELITKQLEIDERIFPFNPRSVTAGFQRVRKKLKIEDLRYHDLRREGASRLFEKGYKIDEVAQVTGHRNLNTLWQVYTELYPNRLHDRNL